MSQGYAFLSPRLEKSNPLRAIKLRFNETGVFVWFLTPKGVLFHLAIGLLSVHA